MGGLDPESSPSPSLEDKILHLKSKYSELKNLPGKDVTKEELAVYGILYSFDYQSQGFFRTESESTMY